MAAPLDDVLAQIDQDTTKCAATVKALDGIISTSMSAADVQAAHDTLAAIATRLEGIAADPNVPVPPGPTPVLASAKRK